MPRQPQSFMQPNRARIPTANTIRPIGAPSILGLTHRFIRFGGGLGSLENRPVGSQKPVPLPCRPTSKSISLRVRKAVQPGPASASLALTDAATPASARPAPTPISMLVRTKPRAGPRLSSFVAVSESCLRLPQNLPEVPAARQHGCIWLPTSPREDHQHPRRFRPHHDAAMVRCTQSLAANPFYVICLSARRVLAQLCSCHLHLEKRKVLLPPAVPAPPPLRRLRPRRATASARGPFRCSPRPGQPCPRPRMPAPTAQ